MPMVILLLLLPVVLILGATLASLTNVPFKNVAVFVGHPYTALTVTTLVAIYFFGIRRGLSRDKASKMATESLAAHGHAACASWAEAARLSRSSWIPASATTPASCS